MQCQYDGFRNRSYFQPAHGMWKIRLGRTRIPLFDKLRSWFESEQHSLSQRSLGPEWSHILVNTCELLPISSRLPDWIRRSGSLWRSFHRSQPKTGNRKCPRLSSLPSVVAIQISSMIASPSYWPQQDWTKWWLCLSPRYGSLRCPRKTAVGRPPAARSHACPIPWQASRCGVSTPRGTQSTICTWKYRSKALLWQYHRSVLTNNGAMTVSPLASAFPSNTTLMVTNNLQASDQRDRNESSYLVRPTLGSLVPTTTVPKCNSEQKSLNSQAYCCIMAKPCKVKANLFAKIILQIE